MNSGLQKTALLTLVALATVVTSGLARPQFVGNLESTNSATVERVVTGREADLVIIDSGWLEGFQTGMACWVGANQNVHGEILLVAVRLNFAIGLITDREEGATISEGDIVAIKTITDPR